MDRLNRKVVDDIAILSHQLRHLYEIHATFDHPTVLECSAELDRLIVQWYRRDFHDDQSKGRKPT